MFLLLALLLPGAPPTFDDHLENLFLLGIGFLIIIFALFACGALLQGLSRAFETSADWLEHKSAKRMSRKRGVLRKYNPPLRVARSRSEKNDSSLLAHDALRRSAGAAHQTEQLPTRPKTNLRIVKKRERM
jgi:hypothetical protein